MSWKNERFKSFRLYAVTDLRTADRSVLKKIEDALAGGADIVQLRAKELSDAAFLRLGKQAKKLCHRYQALFFVNDRADLAWVLQADGLHIGQDDLPVRQARRLLGRRVPFLGKSTHSLQQAVTTAKEDVDYISVGPVFSTPTKPTYKPVGLDWIRQVKSCVRKPFVVIGGIDLSNIHDVLAAGAERVAVVRAIFAAKDVRRATQRLRQAIEKSKVKTKKAKPQFKSQKL